MRKPALVALLVTVMLSLVASAFAGEITKDELKKALNEHPEVILDFLRAHPIEVYEAAESGIKMKERAEKQDRREAELAKPLMPVMDPSRILVGQPGAPISVFVYSDFFCPFCARGAKTMDALEAAHPGQVQLIFKHMPGHEFSRLAALYFEAILLQDQEKAKNFHDLVFASQAKLARNGEKGLKKVAAEVHADMARLNADLESPELAARLDADNKEATTFGFQGTPSFIVNGVSVEGAQPLSEFEEIIRQTSKR